jgi:hypothetical protein
MKKVIGILTVLASIGFLACMASSATADSSRITLVKPPPKSGLELEVGETHTFEIKIKQGDAFVLAMAMPDAYYPGRSIIWHGNDVIHRDDSGLLQLTMTATSSTADLDAVSDWPEPGTSWPAGVAPVSIVAGVRFAGGGVLTERFDFYVVVP